MALNPSVEELPPLPSPNASIAELWAHISNLRERYIKKCTEYRSESEQLLFERAARETASKERDGYRRKYHTATSYAGAIIIRAHLDSWALSARTYLLSRHHLNLQYQAIYNGLNYLFPASQMNAKKAKQLTRGNMGARNTKEEYFRMHLLRNPVLVSNLLAQLHITCEHNIADYSKLKADVEAMANTKRISVPASESLSRSSRICSRSPLDRSRGSRSVTSARDLPSHGKRCRFSSSSSSDGSRERHSRGKNCRSRSSSRDRHSRRKQRRSRSSSRDRHSRVKQRRSRSSSRARHLRGNRHSRSSSRVRHSRKPPLTAAGSCTYYLKGKIKPEPTAYMPAPSKLDPNDYVFQDFQPIASGAATSSDSGTPVTHFLWTLHYNCKYMLHAMEDIRPFLLCPLMRKIIENSIVRDAPTTNFKCGNHNLHLVFICMLASELEALWSGTSFFAHERSVNPNHRIIKTIYLHKEFYKTAIDIKAAPAVKLSLEAPTPEPEISGGGMRTLVISYAPTASSASASASASNPASISSQRPHLVAVQANVQPANAEIWDAYYLHFLGAVVYGCGLDARHFSDLLLYGDLHVESPAASSVLTTPNSKT